MQVFFGVDLVNLASSVAVAFLLTFLLLLWLTYGGLAHRVLDRPNERSLHTRPVARTGGIAIIAGLTFGWLLVPEPPAVAVLCAALALAAISFLDDVRGLPVVIRLLVHLATAAALVWSLHMHLVFVLPATLALVWMTNLFNFMDGSDGLAGGMALIGFGSYGFAAWLNSDVYFAMINWSVASAALAFLCFNFHPARIFMGDVGSIPLGFLAGAAGLVGWQRGVWEMWLPLLVFSPFIVDASVTLMKRLLRAEKVWQAHREHYYQRLVLLGLGHRNTALAEYVLMLAAGGSAVWVSASYQGIWMNLVLVWGLIYLALMTAVDWRWSLQNRNQD
jgi:UDP-N-acetylmuramyl pentapeptide phosphotransferase/UDP-N-acetylglucosamine-1-phosphate transferase